jgi:hypothetical protein
MKEQKMRPVRFIKDFVLEDDIKVPEFGYINVSTSAVKRYHSALALMFPLSPCARRLIDYLVDHMSDQGIVHNNATTKESFQKFTYAVMKKYYEGNGIPLTEENMKKHSYSESAIKGGFTDLAKYGLLVRKSRGEYIVNPVYFFKKGEAERTASIRMVMQFQKDSTGIKVNVEQVKDEN